MSDTPRSHLLAYGLALLLVMVVGVRQLVHARGDARASAPIRIDTAAASGAPDGRSGGSGNGLVVVDVSGAVRHPGVYRLSAGARVDDAVRRAGGTTRRADLTTVNLAAKLEDGRQILVPALAAAAGGGPAAPVASAAGAP